ncbi:MAG: ATP-binding protein [Candidatus Aminicenantes bacterium]|nr:ATP-binding protein [Candidatus Aminicenantes bacterium]
MMEDLSLHVLDIAENAVAAGATRVAILINENERRDALTILVRDNGRGMSRRTLRRALDPFFSTKGKATGLGLPLLAQAAEQSGGRLSIRTTPGQGTKVTVRFRFHHIDRPPLTRMAATLAALIFGHADVGFFYRHRRNGLVFRYDGSRLRNLPSTTAGIGPELIRTVTGELRVGLKRIGRT